MALAILHWEAAEKGYYRFKIDIGTNTFYKFKIGHHTDIRGGMAWVTDVIHTTPFKMKKNSFFFDDTSEEILLPKSYFGKTITNDYAPKKWIKPTREAYPSRPNTNEKTIYPDESNCYIQLISAKD